MGGWDQTESTTDTVAGKIAAFQTLSGYMLQHPEDLSIREMDRTNISDEWTDAVIGNVKHETQI